MATRRTPLTWTQIARFARLDYRHGFERALALGDRRFREMSPVMLGALANAELSAVPQGQALKLYRRAVGTFDPLGGTRGEVLRFAMLVDWGVAAALPALIARQPATWKRREAWAATFRTTRPVLFAGHALKAAAAAVELADEAREHHRAFVTEVVHRLLEALSATAYWLLSPRDAALPELYGMACELALAVGPAPGFAGALETAVAADTSLSAFDLARQCRWTEAERTGSREAAHAALGIPDDLLLYQLRGLDVTDVRAVGEVVNALARRAAQVRHLARHAQRESA